MKRSSLIYRLAFALEDVKPDTYRRCDVAGRLMMLPIFCIFVVLLGIPLFLIWGIGELLKKLMNRPSIKPKLERLNDWSQRVNDRICPIRKVED